MPLCNKCRRREATRQFIHQVDGQEKANLHLCEECARPVQARLDAKAMGRQECEFCGGAAFNPLPGSSAIVYACCHCRSSYARVFLELCARQRPELLDRSKGDIFFFEMCGDSQLEAWADEVSREAIAELRGDAANGSTRLS
jgi:hypothetical protein